jgi:hypothetical protein
MSFRPTYYAEPYDDDGRLTFLSAMTLWMGISAGGWSLILRMFGL